MKITDGVYAYIWTNMMENNCNTFVLKGDSLILIDPGLKRYVPDILDAMKKDGLNPDEIKLVMNTHSHPDHFDGSSCFLSDTVRITMHEEEEKFLNGIGKDFFRMFGLEQPGCKVSFYSNDGELKEGNIALKIIHTPGHSPGSICIYWPEKEVLISGDAVFS
ncbi:MAG: MBL fold metallo-hydrolase, partial [Pseudomonadota bacterium]